MSEFDNNKLRRLDLTVLLIFLGLMRHQKAATVAAEMGLTQSAISHALGRLRDVFGDPLFLRRPHGFEPTSVATELEPTVRRAVEALNGALTGPAEFDPGRATDTVRIAALDYEQLTVLPGFLSAVARNAPGMRFAIEAHARDSALAGLETGRLDLAVGFYWDLGDAFVATPLLRDGYRLVARAGHPVFDSSEPLQAFLAAQHIVVSPHGDMSGIVDRVLAEAGQTRRIPLAVPQFSTALALLASCDHVATLPTRLVAQEAERFGLQHADPPIALRPFETSVVRHRRNARNPMLNWVEGLLQEVATA